MLEIRVLGQWEVVSPAGTRIVISSGKQRELLAFLVAHAPEVVSTDRIVDALWGGEGRDRLGSLRFHVSKLRDVLDPDRDENVIVTRAQGYGIGVDRTSVDAHRFTDLVGQAEKLAADDPAAVRLLLDEALGLWRGAPYAEFEYAEWARSEVLRLEELRLVASELRIDADLAVGRDSGLVPELESLVAEYPLREHFWGQLMIALYRSGRQPEALRAFRRVFDAFGELGTTPSADLGRLEEQILLRDAGLEVATLGAGMAGNLPAPLSSFVGRDAEMEAIRQLVRTQRLVTLVGAGGVGKTRLAIESARCLVSQFGDGVWLVDVTSLDEAEVVVSQLAWVLGITEIPGEDLVDCLVGRLRGRETLLVVDNCEHLVEPVSELVTTLLTTCPKLRVLATSRQPLGVEGEVTWRTAPLPIESEGLAESPAVQLFMDRVHAAQPSLEVTSGARSLAADVCRRVAGLPLAIELAVARLRMMSLEQLSQRLDNQFELLVGGPALTVDHHRAMRATLDWSYRLLDPPEQASFRRLAVFRGGFTLDTAERFHEIFPTAEGNVLRLMGRLVDVSMLVASSDDRFTMLEPIRQYGMLLLEDHDEMVTARRCHGVVYREMFRLGGSVLFSTTLRRSGIVERFVTEMDNVRTALAWALESGDANTAIELGAVAGSLFARISSSQDGMRWSMQEGKRWLDRVISATSEPTPHRAEALMTASLLVAFLDGPDQADALVDELFDTAEALDDDLWRAIAISRRALLSDLADDITTASRLYEEAAERLLHLDTPASAQPLNNYLDLLTMAGNYQRADAVAERLAEIGRRFDAVYATERSLVGRGYTAVCRGDPDEAEEWLTAADQCLRGMDGIDHDSSLEPAYLVVIRGLIALLRDDLDEAEELASAAVGDDSEVRHPDSLYRGLVLAGLIRYHRGDTVGAHAVLIGALRETSRLRQRSWQRYMLAPCAATWAMIDPARGAELLGAVEANNRRDGTKLHFQIAHAVEQATAALEGLLGADNLEAAWRRGAAMGLDDAVALALDTT